MKKWKKLPGDIILLHKCPKNHDHILYCLWDMVRDRCNCYFPFWAVLPFYPPDSPKIENFKKMNKNPWRYHHFIHAYQKLWLNDAWSLRYGAQQMDGWMEKVTDRGGCPTQNYIQLQKLHRNTFHRALTTILWVTGSFLTMWHSLHSLSTNARINYFSVLRRLNNYNLHH